MRSTEVHHNVAYFHQFFYNIYSVYGFESAARTNCECARAHKLKKPIARSSPLAFELNTLRHPLILSIKWNKFSKVLKVSCSLFFLGVWRYRPFYAQMFLTQFFKQKIQCKEKICFHIKYSLKTVCFERFITVYIQVNRQSISRNEIIAGVTNLRVLNKILFNTFTKHSKWFDSFESYC